MNIIYKYQFNITDPMLEPIVRIKMPCHAELLSVQLQDGIPTLWAKIDTQYMNTEREYNLLIFNTGQTFSIDGFDAVHLATLQLDNGLVWHILEVSGL